MKRELNRTADFDSEYWQPTFVRMAVFSLALLAAILSLRIIGGFSARVWARYLTAGPILRGVQNWAVILLVTGLLPCCWQLGVRRATLARAHFRIDRRTSLLLGITMGVLGVILVLRATVLDIISHSASVPAVWSIRALDLAGGLLVPMASGVALIMLPYISLKGMRSAAKLLVVCCLLTAIGVEFTAQVKMVHAVPKGTTETPRHRQISCKPVLV